MLKCFQRLFIFSLIFSGLAVTAAEAQDAEVTGLVKTEKGEAIPYADVAFYDTTTNKLLTGTTTDSSGFFKIKTKPGSYEMKITFLSFKPSVRYLNLSTGENKSVGTVKMKPAFLNLNNVVVQGERSQMQLSFEKRVFQVGKDITSMGGSVLDILSNIPSVMTDFKGNISLRGSNAVRILINGKPSAIYKNGSIALQSISADMIKEIQVITNPSARYSAEGSAGIINIILKKNENNGFNGSIGAMQRIPEASQISANLNYRVGKINWFFNGNVAYNDDPAHSRTYQKFNSADTSYIYHSFNNGNETDYHGNFQTGADVHFTQAQTLTVSNMLHFEDKKDIWHGAYLDSTLSGMFLNTINTYNRIGGGEFGNESSLNYENLIDGKKHKVTAYANYEYHLEKELPHIQETDTSNPANNTFHRISNIRYNRTFSLRGDYVRPVADSGKFEAGLRTHFKWNDNNYTARELINSQWMTLPAFTDNYTTYENLNSVYLTLSSYLDKLSYQLGVRAEQYHIQTKLKATGRLTKQSYIDFFPSIFLTYKFNDKQSVQLSYSRRISRPDTRLLLPFTDYSSSRSRFKGNPNLQPEFDNSYEIEFLQYWKTGSLLTSIYYRHHIGVIEDIYMLDRNGILRTVPFNLSTENSFGLEVTAEEQFTNKLKLTISVNAYKSNSLGEYNSQSYQAKTNRLTARSGINWEILKGLKFQTYARYYGPAKTIQGNRKSYTFVNMAVSKDLFNGDATISLNSEDIFSTRKEEFTINSNDYFSSQKYWEPSGIRLNFIYRINKSNENDNESE